MFFLARPFASANPHSMTVDLLINRYVRFPCLVLKFVCWRFTVCSRRCKLTLIYKVAIICVYMDCDMISMYTTFPHMLIDFIVWVWLNPFRSITRRPQQLLFHFVYSLERRDREHEKNETCWTIYNIHIPLIRKLIC